MITTFLLATLGCISLVLFRILLSGRSTYNFMILNLALAWIPFIFSTTLVHVKHKKRQSHVRIKLLILGILWILFIPNAPYLLTDFIHLKLRDNIPLWYDVLLLESFTLLGLLLGTISSMQIEHILKDRVGKTTSTYISIGIFFLISCGVALGRFFRFNSWDVFISPIMFLKELHLYFFSPSIWIESMAFSIFFFFFLIGTHFLIKTIDEWKK